MSIFLILNCELATDSNNNDQTQDSTTTTATSTVTGSVVDFTSGNPIAGALMRFIGGVTEVGTTTDAQGEFTAQIELEESSDISLTVLKEGYQNLTESIFIIKGGTQELPILTMQRDTTITSTGTSGGPASIYLFSQSSSFIGVKESGDIETAELVFEVQDSSGNPIDINHAVTVNFSFGSAPGGGEYLDPASAETNALGRATVTLNSGYVSGAVQIIARFTYRGNTIQSRPVAMAIHGGFPDENHFHVASEKLNYAAYGIVGFSIPFSALVGDKYSNPVRPGTIVYFSTTSGVIGGSAMTGDNGVATVTLLTQPLPNHPTYGPGFYVVTAATANENNDEITTQTVRLSSGFPIITVNPTTINIQNGGSQTFSYTVGDVNGNPLTEGTSITVDAETDGSVDLVGDINIELPDTQSPIFTSFQFTAFDTNADTTNVQPIKIRIATSGENGNLALEIFGTTR